MTGELQRLLPPQGSPQHRLLVYARTFNDGEAERWLEAVLIAAKEIGDNWEMGDLAGSVNGLLDLVAPEDAHEAATPA